MLGNRLIFQRRFSVGREDELPFHLCVCPYYLKFLMPIFSFDDAQEEERATLA